jgi:hypothetical protein
MGLSPGQTKDYKIGICCSSNKHTALRNKSKDWLDMLSECRDMIRCGSLYIHKLITAMEMDFV